MVLQWTGGFSLVAASIYILKFRLDSKDFCFWPDEDEPQQGAHHSRNDVFFPLLSNGRAHLAGNHATAGSLVRLEENSGSDRRAGAGDGGPPPGGEVAPSSRGRTSARGTLATQSGHHSSERPTSSSEAPSTATISPAVSDFSLAFRQSFGFFDDIPAARWRQQQARCRAQHRQDVYARKRAYEGKPLVTNLHAEERASNFWHAHHAPAFTCAGEERIGPAGDGGKWICDAWRVFDSRGTEKDGRTAVRDEGGGRSDVGALPPLVYSIGGNNDWSFEEAILLRCATCEVHTFDHTIVANARKPPSVTWHDWGLKGGSPSAVVLEGAKVADDRKLRSLAWIRKELDHERRRIDILKIDCEGCEWTLHELFEGQPEEHLPRQILFELHQSPPPVFGFFDELFALGYVVAHTEPNIIWAGGSCVEFVFVLLEPGFCGGAELIREEGSSTEAGRSGAGVAVEQTAPAGRRPDSSRQPVDTDFLFGYKESDGFFDDLSAAQWKRAKGRSVKQRKLDRSQRFGRSPWKEGGHFQQLWDQIKLGKWFFQTFYSPSFTCPLEERLGPAGFGGKWVCDPSRVFDVDRKSAALIYSVGQGRLQNVRAGEEWGFETALLARCGPDCELHAFPDPGVVPERPEDRNPDHRSFGGLRRKWAGEKPTRVSWHDVDVSTHNFLERVVRDLGHEERRIDVLKVDCANDCEWGLLDSFGTVFKGGGGGSDGEDLSVGGAAESLPVWIPRQMMISLHKFEFREDGGRGGRGHAFFDKLASLGYVVAHFEPWPGGNSADFLFVRMGKAFCEEVKGAPGRS